MPETPGIGPETYPIALDGPGRLFQMPRPSGARLREDIATYKALGIDVIVSMLDTAETVELGLTEEAAQCAEAGIGFVSCPVPDMTVPHEAMIRALVDDLAMRLAQGHAVAVHCRAGIGRSGVVTCCLLCHFGQSGDDAIAAVSAARGIPVPDTPEQADFIRQFAQARPA